MARIFAKVDLLLVPSLRDEMLTISNFTGQPSLTLRAGFVKCRRRGATGRRTRKNPLPKFNPPRRVPHGVTLLGRCSRRAGSCEPASRSSGRSTWSGSGRRASESRFCRRTSASPVR